MASALPAILKHNPHSYNGIGITCNHRPKLNTFVTNWSSDSRTFHFSLRIHNNAGIIFEVHETMSPTQAEGRRFNLPLIPFTKMMCRFFPPVLSAQFTVAATDRPSDIQIVHIILQKLGQIEMNINIRIVHIILQIHHN